MAANTEENTFDLNTRAGRIKAMAKIMQEATNEEIVDAIILEKLTDEVYDITKRLRQHVN